MFDSLREFIDKTQELGEVKLVEGADWNLEIGAVTQLMAEHPGSPLLLFDRIKGYPPGYRVASNLGTSARRIAMGYGLPLEAEGIELVRAFRDTLREGIKLLPSVVGESGPGTVVARRAAAPLAGHQGSNHLGYDAPAG